MELHASLYGTMVSYEDLSRSYGLPSGVDLPLHQDHAIAQEFYDKWSVNLHVRYWGGHAPRTPSHPNFSDLKPGDTFQLNENNKCTTKSSCKIETCRS